MSDESITSLPDAVAALGALPMPVLSEPQAPAGGYGPALPWARLMDDEDLAEFLAELEHAIAAPGATPAEALAAVEKACGTWRLIAEAQHGHNTAPGPDAVSRVFSPVASLREPEGEFYPTVHHTYRPGLGRDLPETGGGS